MESKNENENEIKGIGTLSSLAKKNWELCLLSIVITAGIVQETIKSKDYTPPEITIKKAEINPYFRPAKTSEEVIEKRCKKLKEIDYLTKISKIKCWALIFPTDIPSTWGESMGIIEELGELYYYNYRNEAETRKGINAQIKAYENFEINSPEPNYHTIRIHNPNPNKKGQIRVDIPLFSAQNNFINKYAPNAEEAQKKLILIKNKDHKNWINIDHFGKTTVLVGAYVFDGDPKRGKLKYMEIPIPIELLQASKIQP